MVKAVIHAELMEENGKHTVSVKADGYGLDLLDMTAQIAADIIVMGAEDKDLIERRKQYFFLATENDLKNESNPDNKPGLVEPDNK